MRGLAVSLLTPAPAVGLAIPHESIAQLHRRLRTLGVDYQPYSQMVGGGAGSVRAVDTATGAERTLTADHVVQQTTQRARTGLLAALPAALPGICARARRRRLPVPAARHPAVFDADRVLRAWTLAASQPVRHRPAGAGPARRRPTT